MAIVNMPGCPASREDGYKPWTECNVPDEFYLLSLDAILEACANSVRDECLAEKLSGGKFISFTCARLKLG